MHRHVKPLTYLLIVSLIGGSFTAFSKLALEYIPAFSFAFFRLAFGVVITYILVLCVRQRPTMRNFKLFAPIATLWWLNAVIMAFGLQRASATTAQFIHIAVPIITAVLAGVVLRQHFNRREWFGTTVAAVGVAVVILGSGSLALSGRNMEGCLLTLFSSFVFAAFAVGSKLPKYKHIHAFEMIFIAAVCGSLATLPLAALETVQHPWFAAVPTAGWWALVIAGVLVSLFNGGFQLLINRFGPSYATLNLYLLPGFVVVWAALLLDEQPTVLSVAGAIAALVGVWIVSKREKLGKRTIFANK